MKEAMDALIKGLEMSSKAIELLGSNVQSQAKHIKALEDRIEILERTLTGRDNDTLGMDDTNSND